MKFLFAAFAGLIGLTASTGLPPASPALGCDKLFKCSDDRTTLLKCMPWGWKDYKKCEGCCKYGTHGYADCYVKEECPTEASLSSESTTLSTRDDSNTAVNLPRIYCSEDGSSVITCSPNPCTTIATCEIGTRCVYFGYFPVCMRLETTPWLTGESTKLSTREDDNSGIENGKTWKCSKDGTSVLVCEFGFCSTDFYCKRGTHCFERMYGPVCLRGASDLVARDTNEVDSAPTPNAEAPSLQCDEEKCFPESVTATDIKCIAGDSMCLSYGLLVKCGKDGVWQPQWWCRKCIAVLEGNAYCAHPMPQPKPTTKPTIKRETNEMFVDGDEGPAPEEAQGQCTPGTYTCRADYEEILVCNQAGNWQTSAVCGRGPNGKGCCKHTDFSGVRVCDCRDR